MVPIILRLCSIRIRKRGDGYESKHRRADGDAFSGVAMRSRAAVSREAQYLALHRWRASYDDLHLRPDFQSRLRLVFFVAACRSRVVVISIIVIVGAIIRMFSVSIAVVAA